MLYAMDRINPRADFIQCWTVIQARIWSTWYPEGATPQKTNTDNETEDSIMGSNESFGCTTGIYQIAIQEFDFGNKPCPKFHHSSWFLLREFLIVNADSVSHIGSGRSPQLKAPISIPGATASTNCCSPSAPQDAVGHDMCCYSSQTLAKRKGRWGAKKRNRMGL